MREAFLFPLFVVIVVAIVSINADDNENLEAYGRRISKFFEILLPVNILKGLDGPEPEDFSNENSTKCADQMLLFQDGLKNSSVWAVKMVDSSSKLPTGVLLGNVADLGMFDECVDIAVTVGGEDIQGRHCMYDLLVEIKEMTMSVSSSVCLPAACGSRDVKKIMQDTINLMGSWIGNNVTASVGRTTCTPVDPPEWTTGGILTLIGLGLLLSFLVLCTVGDVLSRYNGGKPEPNSLLHTASQFSLLSNAERVLSMKASPQTLPVLQGIRFYSMCWVILGHAHVIFFMNSANILSMFDWVTEWKSLYVMIAPFSVDTFFAISGFLMSYIFLKEMSTGRGFNLFGYYLHRYLRLTPALLALLLITIFISPRLGSGATWQTASDAEQESCRNAWWTLMLYIQNYVITEPRGCLGHTWYLAVEMQFFWLSPCILYPLAKKPKIGLGILAGCYALAIALPIKIGWDHKYSTAMIANANFEEAAMKDFYFASHVRAAPWLAGIFFGYLIFTKKGSSLRTVTKWIGWTAAALAFLFCIFTMRVFQNPEYTYNAVWEACYTAIARPSWALAVLWVIYACIRGFGGPVTTFLSYPIFTPMARISYSVYLVHYQIQFLRVRSLRILNYFTPFNAVDHFFSDLFISAIIGFIFTIVFESPVSALERMIRSRTGQVKNDAKQVAKMDEVEKGVNNPGLITS